MSNQKLLIVTPTYHNKHRLFFISECIKLYQQIDNIIWILCEDGDKPDVNVTELLESSKIKYYYLAFGPTRDKGNEQRNCIYNFIVDNGLEGIVYNADDDNEYKLELFDEIKKTKLLSIFPIGNLGPNSIERPIVKNGIFQYWDAGWLSRKFPIDMGGFAFNSSILYKKRSEGLKLWDFTGLGGETEFIEYIISDVNQAEFLCNDCNECFVKHNELWNKL